MKARNPLLLIVALFLVACPGASTVIKDVAAGAQVVECVDEGIDGGSSIEQIITKCGEEAKPLIEARRALARKRTPCTTITSDAGAPNGPGR